MRSFVKIKPSRNGKITLLFIDIGQSCLSRKFFTSLICLLMLFAKIKFSRKFPNLQYCSVCYLFEGQGCNLDSNTVPLGFLFVEEKKPRQMRNTLMSPQWDGLISCFYQEFRFL